MMGGSSVWARTPPSIGLRTTCRWSGSKRSSGESMVSKRRFFFSISTDFASSV